MKFAPILSRFCVLDFTRRGVSRKIATFGESATCGQWTWNWRERKREKEGIETTKVGCNQRSNQRGDARKKPRRKPRFRGTIARGFTTPLRQRRHVDGPERKVYTYTFRPRSLPFSISTGSPSSSLEPLLVPSPSHRSLFFLARSRRVHTSPRAQQHVVGRVHLRA